MALSDGVKRGEQASSQPWRGAGCWDCPPVWGWRVALRDLMVSDFVSNVSTVAVLLNTLVMCLPYAGQPLVWEAFVENMGAAITYAFIVEMALKLLGLGCAGYWSDGWNVLDGVIVSLSIGEILIVQVVALTDTGFNISFLRMLRLLRLLRLLKAWPGLYKISMAFVKAIPQISNLFFLMLIHMTIFALLGMQAFGGTGLSEESRFHFDYFTDGP